MPETVRIRPVIAEALENRPRLPARAYGIGTVAPGAVEAGSVARLTLTYTAGTTPLEAGMGVSLRIPQRGWSAPGDDPKSPGFVTIETDADADLRLAFPSGPTDYGRHWVAAEVTRGAVRAGERILFHYGGKDERGPGAEVQNHPARGLGFYMAFCTNPLPDYLDDVDSLSFPGYPVYRKRLAAEPALDVTGGPAAGVRAVLPSRAACGEPILLKVLLADRFHNPASRADGTRLENLRWDTGEPVRRACGRALSRLSLGRAPFRKRLRIRAPEAEGVHYLLLDWNGRAARGNPVDVRRSVAERIYWGDLHAQGAQSDGTGEPAEYFRRARDDAFLDAACLTDHSDGLCFPVMIETNELREDKWNALLRVTRRVSRAGRFVAFPAMELSSDIKHFPGGRRERNHRNAYFFGEKNSRCFNWREFPDSADWYRLLEDTRYMIIPHTHNIRLDCRHHDPFAERVIEIWSDKGSGECGHDPERSPTADHGGTLAFLRRGYRVGLVGGGDYHHNTPGRHHPLKEKPGFAASEQTVGGLAAMRAADLSREGIWNALHRRRTHATTGVRALLDVTLALGDARAEMGGEIVVPLSERKKRTVRVAYAGTAPVKTIELVRNGLPDEPVAVWKPGPRRKGESEAAYEKRRLAGEASLADAGPLRPHWLDARFPPMPPHRFVFYYVRMTQVDGERAWSSPVWLSDRPILPLLDR